MKSLRENLINWYTENRRELPWRNSRDPYRIWISEVMLQQTTVIAVIPYYEKFLERFPTVGHLAQAPIEHVLESWAGLGYYSRARNLHRAAQILACSGFPSSAQELLNLPGFGPYTSRAVASLAFSEPVGVLDGNVIRVLSRVFARADNWWESKPRAHLQSLADQLCASGPSEVINQGMMELGATVCTPHNPNCLLCPWSRQCEARKQNRISELPAKRPRKASEVWVWQPILVQKSGRSGARWAVIKNDYAPFLKGQWIFPGTIKRQKDKPKVFDLKHGITHHDIYVKIEAGLSRSETKRVKWVSADELKKISPSSMLQKILSRSQS